MKLILSIWFLFTSFFLLAQAELEEVRHMFTPYAENLPVEIWKGQLNHCHPVELFLAEKNGEVFGYYRLISSGDKFLLEGEKNPNNYQLTEYSEDNVPLGSIVIDDTSSYTLGNEKTFHWYNTLHSDVVELNLKAVSFSDYPGKIFKPQIKKFGQLKSNNYKSYFIERINPDELVIKYADKNNNWEKKTSCSSENMLDFTLQIEGENAIYNELDNKLRMRYKKEFDYYTLENEAVFKKITYASQYFLCDIDYPQIGNEDFDKWIEDFVDNKQKEIRQKIAEKIKELSDEENSTHYAYKWNGWTEIDLFNDQLISGRMVFIKSWDDSTETIPFTYNLKDNEHVDILSQFKSDFNVKNFLNNFLSMEINNRKTSAQPMPENITPESYEVLSLSENNLVVSKDFDRIYGNQEFYIPYSELKSLIRRNSIIKPLIR